MDEMNSNKTYNISAGKIKQLQKKELRQQTRIDRSDGGYPVQEKDRKRRGVDDIRNNTGSISRNTMQYMT